MTAHPAYPCLIWDGAMWSLRTKSKLQKGQCPVHQCRHVMRASQGIHYDQRQSEGVCDKCRKRLSRLNNPLRYRFETLKSRARKTNREFTITFDYLTAMFIESGWYQELMIQPFLPPCERVHVDRIDNSIGYTPDNVRLIRGHLNFYKGFLERQGLTSYEDEPF